MLKLHIYTEQEQKVRIEYLGLKSCGTAYYNSLLYKGIKSMKVWPFSGWGWGLCKKYTSLLNKFKKHFNHFSAKPMWYLQWLWWSKVFRVTIENINEFQEKIFIFQNQFIISNMTYLRLNFTYLDFITNILALYIYALVIRFIKKN